MEPIRGKEEIIDPTYRYKMHKLDIQIEKTKSCITNIDIIANDLKLSDTEPIILYMKKRLSISIIKKKERIIIPKDIDISILKQSLYEFIELFVLCNKCRLPELDYITEKNLDVKCRSCGNTDTIKNTQLTDKIIKYMLAKSKTKKKKH